MISAIVVAAGKGRRFSGKSPKVLSKLGSRPVIYYSLLALSRHPDIGEIIVVARQDSLKEISAVIRRYRINKVTKVIPGGRERKDSVFCGLRLSDPSAGYILVHDGARPFISRKMVSSVLTAAKKFGAAFPAVPVKYTVKQIRNGFVARTLKREDIWEVQTPQAFRKKIILDAYRGSKGLQATDDAMLVEKLGKRVKAVAGSYSNIKITTLEDLISAEAILKKGLC